MTHSTGFSSLHRRRLLALGTAVAAAPLLLPRTGLARGVPGQRVNTTFPDAIAIHGFDPVAYFTFGRPMIGVDTFTASWNGVSWRFVDDISMGNFTREPERWIPAYGGYCAMGVLEGKLNDVDPRVWMQVRDEVFLFENEDRRMQWLPQIAANIKAGAAQWPKLQRG